jgi:hypothetical protein
MNENNIHLLELRARQVGESEELSSIISTDTAITIYEQVK